MKLLGVFLGATGLLLAILATSIGLYSLGVLGLAALVASAYVLRRPTGALPTDPGHPLDMPPLDHTQPDPAAATGRND